MRIAICGTQNIGKSTFVNDMMTKWPMYNTPEVTYRDAIKESGVDINQKSSEESQLLILNALIDEITNATDEHMVFDRCVLDNLVYTMWLNTKGKVSNEFVKKTIDMVKDTLALFDIIFFLPITKHSPIELTEKEQRDIDPAFREEVDVIFKSLMYAYQQTSRKYFPFDTDRGSPPIIEVFGTPTERTQIAEFYINEDGNIFSEEESAIDLEEDDEAGMALANEFYNQSGMSHTDA